MSFSFCFFRFLSRPRYSVVFFFFFFLVQFSCVRRFDTFYRLRRSPHVMTIIPPCPFLLFPFFLFHFDLSMAFRVITRFWLSFFFFFFVANTRFSLLFVVLKIITTLAYTEVSTCFMHLFIAWNCRNAIVYRPLRTSNNTCWSPNSAGGGRCAKTRRTETEGEFDQQLNSSCSSSSLPLLFSHRRLRISSAVSRISHQTLSLVSVCLC